MSQTYAYPSDRPAGLAQPGKLSDLGQPPMSLVERMGLKCAGSEIQLCYSSEISPSDPLFLSYRKAATEIAKDKYPGMSLLCKVMKPEDFKNDFGTMAAESLTTSSLMQRTVQQIINKACKDHASDIHFDMLPDSGLVRMRVHGALSAMPQQLSRGDMETLISVVYNTMSEVADTMYTPKEPQAAMFQRSYLPPELTGIRVATQPTLNGGAMVLRLLYQENIELDPDQNPLDQLGYVKEQCDIFETFSKKTSGIIFIAGKTGSGKSTTLKYVLQEMAHDTTKLIITVEDPPEYTIPGVRQTPVSLKTNELDRSRDYHQALLSALRADPDILMISEVRDAISAVLALRFALSGHPAWTTVHANSAFSIISRLSDLLQETMSDRAVYLMVTDPSLITGLVFQVLVPILCPNCRIPIAEKWDGLNQGLKERLITAFRENFTQRNPITLEIDEEATRAVTLESIKEHCFLRSAGTSCSAAPHIHSSPADKCFHGVVGRQVVAEVVHTNSQILTTIGDRGVVEARRLWLAQNKDSSLQANARKLIMAGVLDPMDAEELVGPLDSDVIERNIVESRRQSG